MLNRVVHALRLQLRVVIHAVREHVTVDRRFLRGGQRPRDAPALAGELRIGRQLNERRARAGIFPEAALGGGDATCTFFSGV